MRTTKAATKASARNRAIRKAERIAREAAPRCSKCDRPKIGSVDGAYVCWTHLQDDGLSYRADESGASGDLTDASGNTVGTWTVE